MTDAPDPVILKKERLFLTRWWRRGRGWRALVVLLAVAVTMFAYFAFTLLQVWSAGRSDHERPVDAIVVMGAAQYDGRPSPQLKARLDHVVELWKEGLAPMVIVTGGNRPGDRFTEAEASRRYLVDAGLPASVIEGEDEGTSSWESIGNVADMADEWNVRTVLLVSDPFHSLRIRLMAEERGLTAYTSATDPSPVRGWTAAREHLTEAAGVAVGRIVGFSTLESWIG
ncbi:MAG: YdcF family protein [Ilumatobacteraceae bacterium]